MDHLNTFATIATPPVKPVIAKANTPFGLPEFSLVAFDQSGHRQPIPPGLAELPLYPDNHGFYSVNGPLDLTGLSPRTVYYPLAKEDASWKDGSDVDIVPFSGETRHTSPHRHSYRWNQDNHGIDPVNAPLGLKGLSPGTVCYPPENEEISRINGPDVDIGPFSSETRHTAPHLPSYYWNPDNHGFYSVDCPLDLTGLSPGTVCYPPENEEISRINGPDVDMIPFYSETRHTTPYRPSYYFNHDAISWFATPPPPYHITCHMSLTKRSVVSHEQVQSGGVTTATSLAAPGEPRFQQSRH